MLPRCACVASRASAAESATATGRCLHAKSAAAAAVGHVQYTAVQQIPDDHDHLSKNQLIGQQFRNNNAGVDSPYDAVEAWLKSNGATL